MAYLAIDKSKIKAACKGRQTEIANALGISQSYLSEKLNNPIERFNLGELNSIAAHLGVDARKAFMTEYKDAKPCGGCRRPVIWSQTRNGKPTPLDPELIHVVPTAKPHEAQIIDLNGIHRAGKIVDAGNPCAIAGRISHFATCPKAENFRKKRP